MKNLLSLIAALLMGLSCMASTIPLGDFPPDGDGTEHKGPVLLPYVEYDNNVVTVWSPVIIDNVEIIIRDVSGAIICQETLGQLNYSYSIILTDVEFCAMHSIEVIYTGHHLYGYFI